MHPKNMNLLDKFNTALQNGLSNEVFDHLRNYTICALLLAIGTTEVREHSSTLFGLFPVKYSGVVLVGFSVFLILFNLYDGIRKFSQLKYNLVLQIILIAIYIFFTIRVTEMAWNFRSM